MDYIFDKLVEWLKEILVGGILDNLEGLFDNVNSEVGRISRQVSATPQDFNSSIYSMIKRLSDDVIIPIAGVILTFTV